MSLVEQRVPITTDGTGVDLSTVRAGGCIVRAIRLTLGTLTTPDLAITEEPAGTDIWTEAGIAADKSVVPLLVGQDDAGVNIAASAVPVPVIDRIQVAISGGGANKTGEIVLLLER